MNKTAWIIFSALCIVFLGGLVWAAQSNKLDVSDIDPWVTQKAEKRNGEIADHVYGNTNAKVTMIEYGDFQCPGCGDFYPIQKEVTTKYQDQVRFIFRNFPLSSLHPNARAAAAAAEAAGLQGKYWEMHDQLYSNQSAWESLNGEQRTDTFASYAVSLGLDKTKFVNDLNNKNVLAKIDFDVALGNKVGVSGTPSIYVDGKLADQYVHNGKLVSKQVSSDDALVWASADTFEKLVLDPALEKAGVALPTGNGEKVATPSGAKAETSKQ